MNLVGLATNPFILSSSKATDWHSYHVLKHEKTTTSGELYPSKGIHKSLLLGFLASYWCINESTVLASRLSAIIALISNNKSCLLGSGMAQVLVHFISGSQARVIRGWCLRRGAQHRFRTGLR